MQGIDSLILKSLISQPAIKAWALASIVIALKTFASPSTRARSG